MTGPRQELLGTGRLGPAGVELLYRTVRQVVRVRNLPPPPGDSAWTGDALREAAHDVLAERTGPARLLELAASSTDEDSFRAQLWRLVSNDLTSQGRRTERGRLAERVKKVADGMRDVVRDSGALRLAQDGAPAAAPEPRFDELVAAAARVPMTVPVWDPDAARRPPVADRDSLAAALRAVLALSPDGLPLGVVVDVLAARLGIHDMPTQAEHDVLDALGPAAADDPAAAAAASVAAGRLLSALTAAEQLVLPYLDEPVSVIAAESGLGRTKAWHAAKATRLKLVDLLADDPTPAGTLRKAAAAARARWGLR